LQYGLTALFVLPAYGWIPEILKPDFSFCFAKKKQKGEPKTITPRFRQGSLMKHFYYCGERLQFPDELGFG